MLSCSQPVSRLQALVISLQGQGNLEMLPLPTSLINLVGIPRSKTSHLLQNLCHKLRKTFAQQWNSAS